MSKPIHTKKLYAISITPDSAFHLKVVLNNGVVFFVPIDYPMEYIEEIIERKINKWQ